VCSSDLKAADIARQQRTLDIELMDALGNTSGALTARRQDELAALDASLRPTKLAIYAALDLAEAQAKATEAQANATEAQKKYITDIYNKSIEKTKDAIDKLSESVSNLKALSDMLHKALNDVLPGQEKNQLMAARKQISGFAASGRLPDQDTLSKALSVISEPSESLYSDFIDYQRDFLRTSADINKLAGIADSQYSKAKSQLDILESQLQMQEKWYENEMTNESVDDLRNRTPNIPDSTVEFYRARISRYIGWQHPAMIVRPAFEPYINDMVSCDPLYLVDVSHELLQPSVQNYNELYQQRLRCYVVNERGSDKMLSRLPDQQFGLILAYNYFNFRPFEMIKQWLTELLQKLKPGGVLLLTFNDCDRDKAVMLVERNFCCYTPGNLVTQLAQTLGFEIIFQWHDDGPSTWLELRRPGTLTTLRGGQALAKIMPK
jgi:hypothetical protein